VASHGPPEYAFLPFGASGQCCGHADTDLRRRLESMGFSECAYRPFERRLVPRREGRPAAANSLFVRDHALVEARLRDASPIEVQGWRF
jgi:hypothetical protein